VDLTLPYSSRTVYIATHTAQGALQREVEHFLSLQLNRDTVDWPTLKAHVRKAFLSPHEDERLRHEVEKLRQTAYETTASFGRRFREAADLAYPHVIQGGAPTRNTDQQRLLLRCYLRGLRDRCIVERLIREGRPDTYEGAMKLVLKYEADDYRLKMALEDTPLDRVEEPMEVGAIGVTQPRSSTPASAPAGSQLEKDFNDMRRQIQGMTQQFTKLMSALQGGSARRDRARGGERRRSAARRHRFTEDGKPVCSNCEKVGHMLKECRSRNQGRSADSQNNQ
jgi:hypothetical protein